MFIHVGHCQKRLENNYLFLVNKGTVLLSIAVKQIILKFSALKQKQVTFPLVQESGSGLAS